MFVNLLILIIGLLGGFYVGTKCKRKAKIIKPNEIEYFEPLAHIIDTENPLDKINL